MDSNKIFQDLKSILENYHSQLEVVHDKETNYYLNTPKSETVKKGEFFGAVQVKKSYVAFHLMPVYYFPELLDDISDELKKRMQGKSCFNFKQDDKDLYKEIEKLTKVSFDKYKKAGKVG